MEPAAGSGRIHADLQTAAHAIREEHRQVEEALREGFSNALTHAIQAGENLLRALQHVPRGQWGSWLKRNVPELDERTERLYRQLATARREGRLPSGNGVTALSIRRARELLAGAASDRADAASVGAADDAEAVRRHGRKGGPIARLLDYGEPFGIDEVGDLDAEDLEDELAGQLRDRYPTHAAEWAEWWAERFKEAGHRVT